MIYKYKLYLGTILALGSIPTALFFAITKTNEIIYAVFPLGMVFCAVGLIVIPLFITSEITKKDVK